MASISSRIFIEPISAVKAEPERPATMIAVSSHTEFAQHEDADQIDHETRRRRSVAAGKCPCWAMIAPTRNEISVMIGHALERDLFELVDERRAAKALRMRDHAHQSRADLPRERRRP